MGPQSAPDSPHGPQPPERTLVSRRAYAAMRGVDDKTVRKAIAAGKIRLVDGMIDPALADADWARNRDAGQASKLAEAAAAVATPEPAAVTAPVAPAAGQVAQQSQPTLELAPLTAARIRATEEGTAIKEIQRRKLEGSLLEAEEVDRAWSEVLQVLKDRLRLIPDNIGEQLAASSDAAVCRSLVAKEVMDALAAMSKGLEGMAA